MEVASVEDGVDPIRDLDIVEHELREKDLQFVTA